MNAFSGNDVTVWIDHKIWLIEMEFALNDKIGFILFVLLI
jgi:hypothetical protein